MEWWQIFNEWFLSLGAKYHVDPYIFGGIYIGTIPLFFLCLSWTIRRAKKGKSIVIPALSTGLCFISSYLYLVVAGKNIPGWVYGLIVLMVVYGVYTSIKKIKGKVRKV